MRLVIKSYPGPGFDNYCTPGHFWPSKGQLVEVVDEEEDPKPTTADHDEGIVRIGKKTMAEVEEEAKKQGGRLSIMPEESIEDVMALKAQIADLKAQLAEAKTNGGKKGK